MLKNVLRKTVSVITATILAATVLISQAPSSLVADAAFTRVSVHDPSIVKLDDGSYYIIGSHLAAARSKNLMQWSYTANSSAGTKKTTYFSDIYTDLKVPAAWSGTGEGYELSGNLWAPDIVYNKQMKKYCMYLSVNGPSWKSSIVLCTSDDIDGPYTYKDTIVYSGFTNNSTNNVSSTDVPKVLGKNPDISRYLTSAGKWNSSYGTNAIDPCVFYDESGNLKMVYGSWFGGIYMLELDEKTGLRDYNVTYKTSSNVSDAYMGKKIAGGNGVSGEGAYIEYMKSPVTGKGYYYLFVSYGYYNANGGYNMRIFRSDSPDGPYKDENGNSAIYTKYIDNIGGDVGVRLMSNYQWSCNSRPNQAQGHNSAIMDSDGKLYVIYHNKFDGTNGAHEVRVHQLIMNEDGWITAAPYEYSGETLSANGHTTAAVTGKYELIIHTLNQSFVNEKSADVDKPKSVSLNSDGTISGDISGKWSMKDGSPYLTITYNSKTYKGAFLAQADESDEMTLRMTFSVTGNNTCIWGSKTDAYSPDTDIADLTDSKSSLVYAPNTVSGTSSSVTLCDTELLSGVSYRITSKYSGLVFDLTNGSTADGTNIQQWRKKSGKPQEWRITALDNGYVKIVSMADESKCAAVASNSAENGVNIELQTYTGTDNQQWKLIKKNNTYGIVSKCSNDTAGIDVYAWSAENGGNLDQWNYWGGDCQLWYIEPVRPTVNDGSYTIRNINSGHYFTTSNGSITQGASQVWKVEKLSNGNYSVRDANGKALTIANGSADNGADIYLADYTGDVSQQFIFHTNYDGSYSLLTASSSGKACADVYNISKDGGANICQWSYWGGAGQKFILEPSNMSEVVIAETTTTTTTTTTDTPKTKGDVNADGVFNISDVIILQKWLLAVPETHLEDWTAADLCEDNKLNVFDLCLMKRKLIYG